MDDLFSPYIRALQSGDKSERKCLFALFFFRKGEYILLFIDDAFLICICASGGKLDCKWTFTFIYYYQITFDLIK